MPRQRLPPENTCYELGKRPETQGYTLCAHCIEVDGMCDRYKKQHRRECENLGMPLMMRERTAAVATERSRHARASRLSPSRPAFS